MCLLEVGSILLLCRTAEVLGYCHSVPCMLLGLANLKITAEIG